MNALPAAEPPPAHLALVADALREITVRIDGAAGYGAGIVWAPTLIVTNAHVVHAARVRVALPDDQPVEARLVCVDRGADLALLRIPPSAVATAVLADSDGLRVGAVVAALGYPFGRQRTLTAGVVHAVGALPPWRRRWIHADLRLAPGNSGGPLADTTGHVVGINTMVAGRLALAIPINDVRRFVRTTRAAAS